MLTVAHILTKRTKKKPQARYDAKFKLIRMLYQRGWEKEEMIKFLGVIDWLMSLPEAFDVKLRDEVHALDEENRMRYMTSFERLAMAEGMQQGIQQGMQQGMQQGKFSGMMDMFFNMLNMRFPNFDLQGYKDKIMAYSDQKLTEYALRIATAKTPEEVFADDIDEQHEKNN